MKHSGILLLAITACVMGVSVLPARGQCPYEWKPGDGLPGLDGEVIATAVYDDGSGPALYAGGSFNVAGNVLALNIAKWNGSTWSALGPPGSGMNGNVLALTVYNGNLIAGGNFTTGGGISANRIAQWNGSSWSALGTPGSGMNSTVSSLTTWDPDGAGPQSASLIAGGSFSNAGGVPASRIAEWNGTSWSALDSGIGGSSPNVWALTVYNGALIAGGNFPSAGGIPANNIAQWNGSSWSALGSGMSSYVNALTVYSGELIAGGSFTSAGGQPANRIAQWNGSSWSALGSGMNGAVFALTVYNSELIAGFSFTTDGANSVSNIAQWDGNSWSALGSGMNSTVFALTIYNGNLIAGGTFTTAGGNGSIRIAQWNGNSWSALGSGMNGNVLALTVFNGNLIAGGYFTTAGSNSANFIAQWNGSSWSALGSGMNSPASALTEYNGALVAGGNFISAGGVSATNIAQWNGSSWSALGSGMNNWVTALTVYNGALIAAGTFTTAGGVSATNIAQWNGSSWSALGGGINGTVYALTVYNGALIAAGNFTTAGGNSANHIAQWNGSSWSALGSGMSSFVETLTVYNGAVIAGGFFTTAGGNSANYIAQWNGSTWSALGSGMDSYVFALTVYNGAVIAGGIFESAGGNSAKYIAQWNGHSWSALGSGMNGYPYALTVYNGELIPGGNFSTVGGIVSAYWAHWGPVVKATTSRVYVKQSATGANDGSSWANAFTDLHEALCAVSASGGLAQEVWVAAGTHQPVQLTGDPRSGTFNLMNGVAIYGGFAGNETDLGQRDPAANVTILTNDDINSTNVVTASGVDATARLDGFTIVADPTASDESVHEFYVNGGPTLANNTIITVGGHYLDLDPDPAGAAHPTMINNKIQVIIKGQNDVLCGQVGSLLELRGLDRDCPTGTTCASGPIHLTNNSLGFSDPFAIDTLTIKAGAKLNLTNRQGLDFNSDSNPPDAIYVKNLIVESGATLNAGLQTLYYQNISDAGQQTDVPLLGFSLVIIDMNCQPEYDARVLTRQSDSLGQGLITRNPTARGANDGVMEMATQAPGKQPAGSVAAKGSFARAGDEEIFISFDYLFRQANANAKLSVSISTDPDVGVNLIPVATLYPPAPSQPGGINSSQMARFSTRFSRGIVPIFPRGTYIELELRSVDGSGNVTPARVWIDNFDPVIKCYACTSFDDLSLATSRDYLVLLSEAGQPVPSGKNCLDLNSDGYVDLADVLRWDLIFNFNIDLCPSPPLRPAGDSFAGDSPKSSESSGVPLLSSSATPVPLTGAGGTFLIAGKPNSSDATTGLNDYLYTSSTAGACSAKTELNCTGIDCTRGTSRLSVDSTGAVYLVHSVQGLLKRDASGSISVMVDPHRAPTSTPGNVPVKVGLDSSDNGIPLSDAAFKPGDTCTNCVYVVPVQVTVNATSGSPCYTYKAAARLLMQSGGNYSVDKLFGIDPFDPAVRALAGNECINCTPSCGGTCTSACDIQGLREIEVDASGNVFVVASTQSSDQSNEWIITYNSAGAPIARISLRDVMAAAGNPFPVPSAPSAMRISRTGDKLYLISANNINNGAMAHVYRFTINSGATGLTFDRVVDVSTTTAKPDVCDPPMSYPCSTYGYSTTINALEEAPDGTLYVLGYTSPRVPEDLLTTDPLYTQLFGPKQSTTHAPLYTTPFTASIGSSLWSSSGQSVAANKITGCDLALPISAVFVPGSNPADFNGSGHVDNDDLDLFKSCVSGPAIAHNGTPACQAADFDHDGDVDMDDFARFQRCFSGLNATPDSNCAN